ncbi:MAG: DUF3800 domain-containing protein [Sulfuricurvum sp.]|jgi:hypothetical protein|nr:MAG: hypothetical protein KU29_13390 [Sulfurovum sp. FS06-10]
MKYKIFCDESNHLHNDKSDLMVIGGIGCPSESVEFVNRTIKHLKHKHNAMGELKWTKLNNNKKAFYKELLEFFFSSVDLRFNAQVVLNKSRLNHNQYNEGEADIFYYKMYYFALLPFFKVDDTYNIFMDYKDTKGGQRVAELKKIIYNTFYGNIDVDFTIIHSHESQIMQLADVMIGAIGYKNRQDIKHESEIKNFIIATIEELGGISLDVSTPLWEEKFRIYRFTPRSF